MDLNLSRFAGALARRRNPERTSTKKWSGRMDLNHRPPGPEPGALARLRYAPTDCRSKKETPLERTQKNSTARFGHSRFIVFELIKRFHHHGRAFGASGRRINRASVI